MWCDVDARRESLKRELEKTQHLCPLCQSRRAVELHEIISPRMGGSKYHPENEDLAALVYVKELCLLLCPTCNTSIANSRRVALLKIQITKYGERQVVTALQGLATRLKCPEAYIPASIPFEGRWIQIL